MSSPTDEPLLRSENQAAAEQMLSFSPRVGRWLCVALIINSMVFRLHDGTLAGMESMVQKQFGVGPVDVGILPTVGMALVVAMGFLFAGLALRVHPYILMVIGISIWTAGEVLRSFSFKYGMFVASEVLLGSGNGPMSVLMAPLFIWCKPANSAALIALNGVAAYAGVYGGIFYGAAVASSMGSVLWPFRFLAAAGVGMLLIGLFSPLRRLVMRDALVVVPPHDTTGDAAGLESAAFAEVDGADSGHVNPSSRVAVSDALASHFAKRSFSVLKTELWDLCRNGQFLLTVLGMSANSFVSSAFFFWGSKMIQTRFHLKPAEASGFFTTATLSATVIGSLAGGLLLDYVVRRRLRALPELHDGDVEQRRESARMALKRAATAERATLFCFVSSLAAYVVGMVAAFIPVNALFAVMATLSLLFSNLSSSAQTIAALQSVKAHQITAASALIGAVSAVMGPMVAPVAIAAITKHFTFHVAICLSFLWLFWTAKFSGVAWMLARRRVRRQRTSFLPLSPCPEEAA